MRSVFLTTCSRCGTHWVRNILQRTYNLEDRPDIHASDAAFVETVQRVIRLETLNPGGKIYREHCPLNYLEVLGENLIILALVRDLRGVVVSSTYWHIARPQRLDAKIKLLGEQYRAEPFEPILNRLKDVGHNMDWHQGYMEARGRVPHSLIRYEDMVDDPFGTLMGALADWGLSPDPDRLKEAIQFWSFERLSGGRQRGEQNDFHHYRKGDPQDWKNYFSEEESRAFYRKFEPYLKGYGYSEEG